jgi:hypothetical protein
LLGAGCIFFLALGLRLDLARGLAGPLDTDSSDYLLVARNLFQGRGFVEDVVWNFLSHPAAVAHPRHDSWMPLETILIYVSQRLWGQSFWAAELPGLALGAALPVVGMAIALELGAGGIYAAAAGILLAVGPRLVYYSIDTDAMMAYAFFQGLVVLSALRGLQGRPRWLALAGVAAGLAHLSRNDASIWVPALILIFLLGRRRDGNPPAPFRFWLLAGAGYLLVMAPWMARNLSVFGTLFPPNSTQAMFFHDYLDLYGFDQDFTLRSYLAQGPAVIAGHKAAGLAAMLKTVWEEGALVRILIPFAGLGVALAPAPGRRVMLAHLGLIVLVWSLLMEAYAGPYGGTVRTAAGLAVYLVPAAMLGLERAGAWLQEQVPVPGWLGPALALALAGGLCFQVVKSQAGLSRISHDDWNYFHELGQFLKQASPAPAVMTFQPWQLNWAESLPAVSIPSNGLGAIAAAGRKYGVEFLVLDNYWIRNLLGYRAEAAYLESLAREFQATGRSRDPDFIPAGRFKGALIFRLAPARVESPPRMSP